MSYGDNAIDSVDRDWLGRTRAIAALKDALLGAEFDTSTAGQQIPAGLAVAVINSIVGQGEQ